MGPDFWSELPQIFAQLDADPEVRAVVLTGAGKHFSYGLDLPAMAGDLGSVLADKAQAKPRTDFHAMVKRMQAAITAVADCRKPVVAAISGWCIGGGVDLISQPTSAMRVPTPSSASVRSRSEWSLTSVASLAFP